MPKNCNKSLDLKNISNNQKISLFYSKSLTVLESRGDLEPDTQTKEEEENGNYCV